MDVLIKSKTPPTIRRVCSLGSFLRDLKIVNEKQKLKKRTSEEMGEPAYEIEEKNHKIILSLHQLYKLNG